MLVLTQEGNRRIFPPLGKIEWVTPVSAPPFTPRTRSRNGRISAGLKYETSVHKKLERKYGPSYVAGPWYCYKHSGEERRKYCQLDGVLDRGLKRFALLEIKYSHCPESYFQLTNLYLPIMRFLWPGYSFSLIEVVKWYDPAVVFPVPITLLPKLHEAHAENFSVHIINR